MADSVPDDERVRNLCGRKHEIDWLQTRQSCIWASEELPSMIQPPPFGSKERNILHDALIADGNSISSLERQLISIEKQITALRQESSKKRAQLSPTRLVPPEILSRIFHYVASGTNARAFEFNSPIPPILVVCKEWHEIALASHSLWDGVCIPSNANTQKGNDDRLRAWLALSSAPLEIFHRNTHHDFGGNEQKLVAWEALFDTPRPWKHFRCCTPELIQRFLSIPPKLSHLESLTLEHPTISLPRNLKNEIVFSKLKEITLSGRWVPSILSFLQAPQAHSVTIENCDVNRSHMIQLSQDFPILVELYLCDLYTNGVQVPADTEMPLIFPCMESLLFSSVDYEFWNLSWFQASPQLRDINVSVSGVFTILAAPLLCVTELDIEWWFFLTELTVSTLYASLPQLRELTIYNDGVEYTESAMGLELLCSHNPMLCKKLELLNLSKQVVPNEVLMALSRCRSGTDNLVDSSNPQTKEEYPALLLITITSCHRKVGSVLLPLDVNEASYETLCKQLREYPVHHDGSLDPDQEVEGLE